MQWYEGGLPTSRVCKIYAILDVELVMVATVDTMLQLTICGCVHSGEQETKITRAAPASLAI